VREEVARDAGPVRRRPGRPRLAEPSAAFVARRDEIVEVAAQVFRRRGYDAGSLDDVAAELELRRASLYHYVTSKAELLHLIFDRAISTALDRLEELAHIEDPRERLAALIRHQVKTVTDEPTMFTVFFDNRPRLDEAYEAGIRTKERRYVRIFAEAIRAASAAGTISELDARYGAQALLGMTSWTYKWFDPSRDDAEQLAETLTRLVLHDDAGSA
jgi:AcrR family transcriptional regulator